MAYREVLFLRQFRAGLIQVNFKHWAPCWPVLDLIQTVLFQTADQLEFSISSIEVLYNEYLLTLNDQVETNNPPPTNEDASSEKPTEELSDKEKSECSSSSETTEISDEEQVISLATVESKDDIQGKSW